MQIILLSGGSGKRLWPLSNETRSKQFLKILPDDNGSTLSMVQRVHKQINNCLTNYSISISTSEKQKAILERQLNCSKNNIDIICEPSRRNTFPAVLLSAAYLIFKKKVDLNETVIYSPIDSFVSEAFFKKFESLDKLLNESGANICLLGIKPTYPSEKYGYIIEKNNEVLFKEKPDEETAKKYIKQNALWNSGVFCTKLSYLKNIIDSYGEFSTYEDVLNSFDTFDKKSFDVAVLEKEKNIKVDIYNGEWKDLGTWNTLTEEINDSIGKVIMGESCKNTNVLNELHIPIIALGLKNVVVAASPDGILVADKIASVQLNNYVSQLTDRIKYEERVWGRYVVLDETEKKLVKTLYVDAGKNLSYQRHTYRDEVWTIVSGTGLFVLNDEVKEIKENDVLYIPRGSKHAIKAIDNLEILEVQLGSNFIEEDIERFEYNWK